MYVYDCGCMVRAWEYDIQCAQASWYEWDKKYAGKFGQHTSDVPHHPAAIAKIIVPALPGIARNSQLPQTDFAPGHFSWFCFVTYQMLDDFS